MIGAWKIAGLALLSAIPAGCERAEANRGAQVAAKVNGAEILVHQVKSASGGSVAQTLDRIIDRELLVQKALAAGLGALGENRVQEARAKIAELGRPVPWHLVGHLQTNKAREALELFDVIHSLDRPELALDNARAVVDANPLVLFRVLEISWIRHCQLSALSFQLSVENQAVL